MGLEQEIADLYIHEAGGMLRYAAALAPDGDIARDAVQEAFFRLFVCRSGGQSIASPKAWLFRVVRNYILDQRKAGARNTSSLESLLNVAGPALTDGGVHTSELLTVLPRIGLSPREIECVRLRTEDLRYEEIASVLGLQAGTVGALLARAHEKIRNAVSQKKKSGMFAGTLAREKRYAS